MPGWSMKQRNIVAAAVLILLSMAYGYLTSKLPIRTLPDTPDPAFMPWINTVLLCGLGALLLWQALGTGETDDADRPGTMLDARTGAFLAVFVGYVVLLPVLGFVFASIPFFAVVMMLFGERRRLWILIGSVAGPLLMFAIFRHGFDVVLPRGVLGSLLG
jgi:hypothetical protein